MNQKIIIVLLAVAALAAVTVGVALTGSSGVSAQTETETVADGDGFREGHQMRGKRLEVLTEVLGVSAEDLRAALREGQAVADVAAEQGVAVQDVVDALVAGISEKVDAAVTAGRLEAAQAGELLAMAETKAEAVVNGEYREKAGNRFGFREGHQMRGKRLEVLTEVLGVSAEDLRAALREGQAVADVAAEQGVAVQDVVDALVAGISEKVDAAVTAGRLEAAQAGELLAMAETKAEAVVNGEYREKAGNRFGHFGRRGLWRGGEQESSA